MDDVGHSRIRDAIKSSRSQRQRLADDDGIKFFRLIHVICQSPPEIFTTTYRSVHALPRRVWDTLRADPRRSNAILSHAEKALTNTVDEEPPTPKECWITCSTVNLPSSETMDFILSCTDTPMGSYPIFIYSTRHSSRLADDFLLSRLSLLVNVLHSTVSVSRVFSVFAPDPVTEMFTKLWVNLTGIHPAPQPYFAATFTACTKFTLADRSMPIHPALKYHIRSQAWQNCVMTSRCIRYVILHFRSQEQCSDSLF